MKLIYYGGDGFGGCKENWNYVIKYGKDGTKKFTSFSEAKKFYDALDCEKFFWSPYELLDAYIEVPNDYKENED